jgi:hypothetical protein
MLDFAQCEQLVSSARDKRSKPYANNTRIERRDEDTYALRLHATDIATFHRDGRVTLNSGGWRTVTTKDRLSAVTPHIVSERGDWYVRAEPDPDDPRPERWPQRTIPKPFHALDPGPEPVKPTEGCIAGTETCEPETREVFIREGEHRDDDITLEHCDGYFSAKVRRVVHVATAWREEQYNYHAPRPETTFPDADEHKWEQCPHCALFERQHRAWSEAMNGGGWGRNRTEGYAKMTAMLERFETREAWQDAYLEEFRAVKAARKLYREWDERNRVPFTDGMEVNAEGYAPRPNRREIERNARRERQLEKKKKRINKFVADAVNELVTNGLKLPSGGDCWGCALRDPNEPRAEAFGTDHLEQHIRERYYVPSMFVNALREAGYSDTGVFIHLGMDPDEGTMGGEKARYGTADVVTRALRTYLYRRLIPETYGAGVAGVEVTA